MLRARKEIVPIHRCSGTWFINTLNRKRGWKRTSGCNGGWESCIRFPSAKILTDRFISSLHILFFLFRFTRGVRKSEKQMFSVISQQFKTLRNYRLFDQENIMSKQHLLFLIWGIPYNTNRFRNQPALSWFFPCNFPFHACCKVKIPHGCSGLRLNFGSSVLAIIVTVPHCREQKRNTVPWETNTKCGSVTSLQLGRQDTEWSKTLETWARTQAGLPTE